MITDKTFFLSAVHTPFIFLWKQQLLVVEFELPGVCPLAHEMKHALLFYGVCQGNVDTYKRIAVIQWENYSDKLSYFFGNNHEIQACLQTTEKGYNDGQFIMIFEGFPLPTKPDSGAQLQAFPIPQIPLSPVADEILTNPTELRRALCASLVTQNSCAVRAGHAKFDWIIRNLDPADANTPHIATAIYETIVDQIKEDMQSFPQYPFDRLPPRSHVIPL